MRFYKIETEKEIWDGKEFVETSDNKYYSLEDAEKVLANIVKKTTHKEAFIVEYNVWEY